jgi:hypothetical protein
MTNPLYHVAKNPHNETVASVALLDRATHFGLLNVVWSQTDSRRITSINFQDVFNLVLEQSVAKYPHTSHFVSQISPINRELELVF